MANPVRVPLSLLAVVMLTATAALRVERDLGGSFKLGISYLLDYYSDGSYADLTGGLNTFIMGVGYRF